MSSRLRGRIEAIARAGQARLATLGRRHAPTHPERILVAHHLLLGDTLMLTPLLAKIRQRWPDADLAMTVPSAFLPLYSTRPYGVRALAFEPKDRTSLRALWRESGFDLAVVPGDNRFSWLAAAMHARWIVAFAGDRKVYGFQGKVMGPLGGKAK